MTQPPSRSRRRFRRSMAAPARRARRRRRRRRCGALLDGAGRPTATRPLLIAADGGAGHGPRGRPACPTSWSATSIRCTLAERAPPGGPWCRAARGRARQGRERHGAVPARPRSSRGRAHHHPRRPRRGPPRAQPGQPAAAGRPAPRRQSRSAIAGRGSRITRVGTAEGPGAVHHRGAARRLRLALPARRARSRA